MNLPLEGDNAGSGEIYGLNRAARPIGGPAKPITMATIAKMAGVSQGAISSLLNDRDYGIRVSDKTRERVFKVCRELGYIPNDLRAEVRMYPETGDTCLLVSDKLPGGLANPFAARVASALLSASSLHDIVVAVYSETREYTPEDPELPAAIRNGTASKFVCVGTANASLCKITQRRGYPVIVVGHESHIFGTSSIVPDYTAAARIAMSHLAQLGHRDIGIISGPFGSLDPRLAELNRAIGIASSENGIAIAAQNIFQGDLSFEAGLSAVQNFSDRIPPTALICISEASACGAAAAAMLKGISVPEKLSVIAFSDQTSTPSCAVPITTVVSSVDELAIAAANEAERQIREGMPSGPRRSSHPVSLVQRASTAPAVHG
jgi:DNA-binding LacI/PurR family transcriptional regulator